LKEAGKRGWVVLTCDQHIRRRPNELQAFRDNGVVAFVLTAGDASAAETAALVCRLYPKLIRKARATKPPSMFSVTLGGTIHPIKL
jgi:PIN like domain